MQWRLMNSHGTATILAQHMNKLYYPSNLSYKPHLLQPHLHSRLSTWLQWIEQRQMQDETRNIYALGFGIRGLTVKVAYLWILCVILMLTLYWCVLLWWHIHIAEMVSSIEHRYSFISILKRCNVKCNLKDAIWTSQITSNLIVCFEGL